MSDVNPVFVEVGRERQRQELKFPEQHLPDGTKRFYIALADNAKMMTDRNAANGTLTWSNVLTEEVMEAFAEHDEAKLRAELIQVAAVAIRWIEDIDRRAS
jgi:hypothetical protein